MKRNLLFLTLLIVTTLSFGQDNESLIRPKGAFSVGLLSQISTTQYVLEFGETYTNSRASLGQILQFKYRYNFSSKFYTEASWGIGPQIEQHKSIMGPIEGFRFWNYHAFPKSRIEFSGVYTMTSFGRNKLNARMGLGWSRFLEYLLDSRSTNGDGSFYEMSMIAGEKRLPFLTLGLEYGISTKRMDEISFYLGFQRGFNSYIQGDFKYVEGGIETVRGNIINNLSALQFGVNYTFTRIKKFNDIALISREENLQRKEARKKSRTARRIIDPKSQFITAGFGLGINNNKFRPRQVPLRSPNFPSFSSRFAFEWGYKNNFFFEVDYFGFQFWQGEKLLIPYVGNWGFGSDAMYGHFLSFGMQYKIQNQNTHLQFFNIHAGIGLGAHFRPKGMDGLGSVEYESSDQTYNFNYTSISEVRGHLMPVMYGGISKDIRITERFLLNLMYKHQLGFHNVYATQYVFSDSNTPEPIKLNSKIDGTAFLVQLGFKYRMH